MSESPIVLYTDHIINKTLCYSFAKGCGSKLCHVNNFKEFDKTIATYGYLRGAGKAIKKAKNFYYIDHGYFKQSNRNFQNNKTLVNNLDGYFRVVFNDFWHDGQGNKLDDRLNKLNLKFNNLNRNGEYILISEPTSEAVNYYNLFNWTENTINEIKKYTDRKIILHNRNSKIPLNDLLPKAWAFVSDHSSAAFKAMQKGVPSYFTNKKLMKIGKIKDIEKHEINYSVFNNLAYEQWTIDEIKSGEAWNYLSKKLNDSKK